MNISEKYNLSKPFACFEEFSKIPHGSGDMERISNYCKEFAESRGLNVIQDSDYNLIISMAATPGYEDRDILVLQGHLDMVCEKVPGSDFDFKNDSLILESDGIDIWAKGTTLGGDNGIAIAMGLAIMDDESIQHGPLEFIFTVDEENGLNGAKSIDLTALKGRKLINLDSEEDSTILTSCAGGAIIEGLIPVERELVNGVEYQLVVEGMKGGHSGIEINKGHGNSNVLLGRVLDLLDDDINLGIISANGGKLDNVITSHTVSNLIITKEEEKTFLRSVKSVEKLIKKEMELSAPDLSISVTKQSTNEVGVLTKRSKEYMINALMNLPNGVQAMSLSIEGMVETSLNMGVMNLDENRLKVEFSARSSVGSAKEQVLRRVTSLVELMGGTATVLSSYPGWEYRVDSPLRETVAKVYEDVFGTKPIIGAIHAGLECGLLADKVEGLDCISIGPNLKDVHSVNEIMNIASVEKVWKLLLAVLAN